MPGAGDCPKCGFVRNQRWRPVTGGRYDITHISACINYIATHFQLVFLGPGNKTRLLWRLLYVWTSKESLNQRWHTCTVVIFNTFTTNPRDEQSPQLSIRVARSRKHGYSRWNVVAIMLRYVLSYLLPVNGRHFRFPTYQDVGQYSHQSFRVTRPRKHGYSRWNSVVVKYTN